MLGFYGTSYMYKTADGHLPIGIVRGLGKTWIVGWHGRSEDGSSMRRVKSARLEPCSDARVLQSLLDDWAAEHKLAPVDPAAASEPPRLLPESIRIPDEAASVPDYPAAMYEALVASVREHGVRVPISVCRAPDRQGWLCVSGRHRLRAARDLGLKTIAAVEVPRPDDLRAAILEEALVCRDLPKLGRAWLILENRPDLMARAGAKGNPNGLGQMPGRVNKPSYCHSVAIGSGDETLNAVAKRYGIHRDYFTSLIQCRGECREIDNEKGSAEPTDGGRTEWLALGQVVYSAAMGARRALAALRGLQSGGRAEKTGLPGRAGADYEKRAIDLGGQMLSTFRHWDEVPADVYGYIRERATAAFAVLPDPVYWSLRDAVAEWPVARARELQAALAERIKRG